MDEIEKNSGDGEVIERLRAELEKAAPSKRDRIIKKFVLAALGSIPWIGGFLSAAASYRYDETAVDQDSLQTRWLEEHYEKLSDLRVTMGEIQSRFESLGESIDDRIQSEQYLSLVRKTFRAWDEADTAEKRQYAANLIVNAAGTRVCSDDVVRLFLDWLELYHETHFAVIREVYSNPGSTRFDIWSNLYGATPLDNSAEADLYRYLIRDLSTGGVIRQERDVNRLGEFVRKKPARSRPGQAKQTMESAFEQTKPYVLTELGKQFVHYTMNEVVGRIEGE